MYDCKQSLTIISILVKHAKNRFSNRSNFITSSQDIKLLNRILKTDRIWEKHKIHETRNTHPYCILNVKNLGDYANAANNLQLPIKQKIRFKKKKKNS